MTRLWGTDSRGKVSFYVLLPCMRPASLGGLLGGVWQLGPWQLHPMSLLFALSGTAMISKTLRIPKF